MTLTRYLLVAQLLLCGFSAVSAQPAVEAKVERLEQTIRLLERRIEALEEQLRQRSAPTPVSTDKMNWRKLQRGMSESEVEQLLGSPARVDATGGSTHWYYPARVKVVVASLTQLSAEYVEC
jgi:outer membrane protein assembly factor BamE (lipoprotein component of BamABCDE complex)